MLVEVDRNWRFCRRRYFFLSGASWYITSRLGPFKPSSSYPRSERAYTEELTSITHEHPLKIGNVIFVFLGLV